MLFLLSSLLSIGPLVAGITGNSAASIVDRRRDASEPNSGKTFCLGDQVFYRGRSRGVDGAFVRTRISPGRTRGGRATICACRSNGCRGTKRVISSSAASTARFRPASRLSCPQREPHDTAAGKLCRAGNRMRRVVPPISEQSLIFSFPARAACFHARLIHDENSPCS